MNDSVTLDNSRRRPDHDPIIAALTQPPSKAQKLTITKLVLKDVILNPQRALAAVYSRRIPIGIYITVTTDEFEFKTLNKPLSQNGDVEWDDTIILPSDVSSQCGFKIHATFELEPVVGQGELLHTFQADVTELLEPGKVLHLKPNTDSSFPSENNETIITLSSLHIEAEYRHDAHKPTFQSPSSDPSGDAQIVIEMTNAGHDTLLRYRQSRQEQDLLGATKQFETALDFCSPDHPFQTVTTFNLAAAKFISSQIEGKRTEIDSAISLYRETLRRRISDNPDRNYTLLHLAIALLSRSNTEGPISDIQEAAEILSILLKSSTEGDFLNRILQSIIETYGFSVHTVDNDSDLLDALDEVLKQCLAGDRRHLDRLIVSYDDALLAHRNARLLGNYGVALNLRFDRDGQESDLDDAISRLQQAVSLSPDRVMALNNLSGILNIRFARRGNTQDLENAILYSERAIALEPNDTNISLNLSSALGELFKHRKDLKDLDRSILYGFQALAPPIHVSRIPFAIMHADRLRIRYNFRRDRRDSETCIRIVWSALSKMSVQHKDRPTALNVLVHALNTHFKDFGNKRDLDSAIFYSKQLLALLSPDNSLVSLSDTLYFLAGLFQTRFEQTGDIQDLNEAISLYREDLLSYPEKVTSLCGLSLAQRTRYLHQGDKQDLYDTILQLRKCLTSDGGDNNIEVMMNLAEALVRHSDNLDSKLQTVDEAVQLYRRCLTLLNVEDLNYAGCMNNLAGTLFSRYRYRKTKEGLEEVIMLYRKILATYPVTGPRRSKSLTNLGNAMMELEDKEVIDEAISLHKEALQLQPDGDPFRPVVLSHLAKAYLRRYNQLHRKTDLDAAEESALLALRLYRPNAVERASPLLFLAETACEYFEDLRRNPDGNANLAQEYLDKAMNYFKDAAELHASAPMWWLKSAGMWARHAEKYNHDSALAAYSRGILALDTHLSSTPSISSRRDFLRQVPHTFVNDAASCALRRGDVYRAVEFLEQGRTLIWTQISRYRTPVDELNHLGEGPRELADRFRNLSSLLENPRESEQPRMFEEEKTNRYERVVNDWKTTVEEIRKLDGFNRFLLPPLYSNLSEAACDGPVIMFVASKYSCDAIIVQHKPAPLHVPLTVTFSQLARLGLRLMTLVSKTNYNAAVEGEIREILQELWDAVVSPVMVELQKVVKKRSRIWWCPTSVLALFPLHAAGEYLRPQGKYLSQFYISSYTPSLSALLKARAGRSRETAKRFAAMGQAQPSGYNLPLMSVEKEIHDLECLIPGHTVTFTKVTSAESTKDVALQTLQNSNWVHLACHGVQQFGEPYKSGFLLRDEPLTLLDISKANLRKLEFAFLSACQTAHGDVNALDEVIHLAAGLQFAGVKSVIGTLWEVEDATVGCLVEAFYKNMFAEGGLDCTKAAGALHKALRSPAVKNMSLTQRILFIHIGI